MPQPDRQLTKEEKTKLTVIRVVGGIVAFFSLLCFGFVFFIAVVCGSR